MCSIDRNYDGATSNEDNCMVNSFYFMFAPTMLSVTSRDIKGGQVHTGPYRVIDACVRACVCVCAMLLSRARV